MEDDKRPLTNAEFTLEAFDDEILLYSKAGTQAVYLNDTAHAVWLLCKDELTVGQIIEYLEQAYPKQKDQIRQDVTAALTKMADHNVIKFTDAQ